MKFKKTIQAAAIIPFFISAFFIFIKCRKQTNTAFYATTPSPIATIQCLKTPNGIQTVITATPGSIITGNLTCNLYVCTTYEDGRDCVLNSQSFVFINANANDFKPITLTNYCEPSANFPGLSPLQISANIICTTQLDQFSDSVTEVLNVQNPTCPC